MLLAFKEILDCDHEYKLLRDSAGGVSASVCYKCGWTEKAILQLDEAMTDLKESVSLLELFETLKEKKDKEEVREEKAK